MSVDPRQVLRAARSLAHVLGLLDDWQALDESTTLSPSDVADFLEVAAREVAPPKSHDERVAELHSQGLNDPAIAARIGLSPSQVCRIRRRLKLPGLPNAKRSGWQRKLREAHLYGLTPKEIARRLGWTVGTVYTRSSTLRLPACKGPVDGP